MTDTATTESTHESRIGSARTAIDLLLVAVLGAVFLRVAVWPTLVHHYPFGVGPDMPVYLWWSRVGVAEGISLVGERPGTPALIPTVASALGIGLVPAVAAVQYALMPASALAAAALARGRGETPRLAWIAGAVLAGAWTTFLAGGYLANLALVAALPVSPSCPRPPDRRQIRMKGKKDSSASPEIATHPESTYPGPGRASPLNCCRSSRCRTPSGRPRPRR